MTELSVTLNPAYTGSKIKTKTEVRMSKKTQEETPGTAAVATDTTQQTPAAEVKLEKSARELELEAKLADSEAKLAKSDEREAKREEEAQLRRKREDEKDWELLLAQGFTEPYLEEAEKGFMAKLSEDTKEDFLALRRSMNKVHDFTRKSNPSAPAGPVKDENVTLSDKQNAVMQAAREAAGIKTNGQTASKE